MTAEAVASADTQADVQDPQPLDIPMEEVESSQVHSIGYSAEHRTLAMRFRNKSGPSCLYQYPNVEPEAYEALRDAESIGRHFGQHVKHLPFNKFPKH